MRSQGGGTEGGMGPFGIYVFVVGKSHFSLFIPRKNSYFEVDP